MGARRSVVAAIALCAVIVPGLTGSVYAARISDISNTKHNFSAGVVPALPGGQNRVVSAVSEQQICVFCHTPHGAEPNVGPLWNRKLSGATYETYRSGSIDATGPDVPLGQPTGISKLCLSCHDGTMAIGAVNVLNGSFTDQDPGTADIQMQGTNNGKMAQGEGINTGFTRYIGTDLTNDHPISVTYDSTLAAKDGDMRDPANVSFIGNRAPGVRPEVPLQDNQVQCNTCHDPHIRDDTLDQNIKFLRLNRLQARRPTGTNFSPDQDIICLACHDKEGWVDSAHANPDVADEQYTNAAANVREFPTGTKVWETACLACHDTHTVQGSRRLLREGTDGPTKNVGGYNIKQGGRPAIEQTCYACHSSDGGTLTAQGIGTEVPDIKSDFTTLMTNMPITTDEQSNGANDPVEVHNIGAGNHGQTQAGKDFIEGQDLLANRHAECTDCHNPHRVIKNQAFNANPANRGPAGTHVHDNNTPHTNIASGVLRGTWGVEPQYGSTNFNAPVSTITFDLKRGNPPINAPTGVGQPYVTREYQVCLKCHSNYAYGNNPPMLGSFSSGTASGTNQMTQYTNQASEYNSPTSHMSEGTATNGGAAFETNNHRSWHPVIRATGRTAVPGGSRPNCGVGTQNVRCADSTNWMPPFDLAVGTQTMYCTDCHGSNTQQGTSVPDGNQGTQNGRVWGPHGSENIFILKGPWSGDAANGTGEGTPNHFCFKCHDYNQFGNTANTNIHDSGFSLAGAGGAGGMCMMGAGGGGMGGGGAGGGMGGGGAGGGGAGGGGAGGGGGGMMCMAMGGGMGNGMGGAMNNLHIFHANAVQNFRCNLCHVAVPHGWKNKVFLVNLNDVGPEGGLNTGTQVRNNTTTGYFNGPYYNRAALKVASFAQSGQWSPTNCGSAGPPGNNITGVQWMAQSNEACVQVP